MLIAILGIGVLMIVHEGGHYLAARMFGMRVLRFSIGIGPTIWRRQLGEHGTIFQVAAVPFLAYVQIASASNRSARSGPVSRISCATRLVMDMDELRAAQLLEKVDHLAPAILGVHVELLHQGLA